MVSRLPGPDLPSPLRRDSAPKGETGAAPHIEPPHYPAATPGRTERTITVRTGASGEDRTVPTAPYPHDA